MRDDKRRLNLSLDMKTESHRRAWEIVSAIPRGQKTETICRMLIEHKNQTELLEAIRHAVREELEAHGELSIKTENIQQSQKTGAVRDDILGFLRDLQERGDDD